MHHCVLTESVQEPPHHVVQDIIRVRSHVCVREDEVVETRSRLVHIE